MNVQHLGVVMLHEMLNRTQLTNRFIAELLRYSHLVWQLKNVLLALVLKMQQRTQPQ